MRIIRMGNVVNHIHTCPYCNCEYEYDDSDTNIGYDLTAQYLYVYCPCCHKENILNNFTRTYDIPLYYPGPIFCNQEAQIHSWNQDERCDEDNGDDNRH